MKTCKKCSQSKPLSCFKANARYADGHVTWCAECHAIASKEWYQKNKDKSNERARQWAAQNKDKALQASRAFHARNKESRAAQHKEWAAENLDLRRATSARRKAAKVQATPKWANSAAIKAIYASAVAIQRQSGQRMHVDHIVPLQSDLVCGLHCEANLRVIPGCENESKRNFWWPDMPEIANAQRQQTLFDPAPVMQQEALL